MPFDIVSKLDNRIRRPWRVRRLRRRLHADNTELIRLGTEHGGWTLPARVFESKGTAICVGAGEDISFDVELNKQGFTVYTVDPTPRAKEHVTKVLEAAAGGPPVAINHSADEVYDLRGFDAERFTFVEMGVWNENAPMRFFGPKDPRHVSHSIVNLQRTDHWFEANCATLGSICESHKIGQIDVLKLDVEGAEYTILENILENGPLPKVVCMEFDEIRNPIDSALMKRIMGTMDRLVTAGYRFRHLENSNTLLVR